MADLADLPPLHVAYSEYLVRFAPYRPSSVLLGPLTDFVDVLREHDNAASYSDEEWIAFLLPYVGGDEDEARDLWDALLCQPSYDHGGASGW